MLLIGHEPHDINFLSTYEELQWFKEDDWDSFDSINDSKWVFRKGQETTVVEVAWPGSSGEMILRYAGLQRVAAPEICLLLKLSHRYLSSPHFKTTMQDIKSLRADGYELDDTLTDILKIREKEIYSQPNPDKVEDEFFADGQYEHIFTHDSLHEAVKLNEQPAYTYFKVPGKEKATDMNKFDQLPLDIQLAAVYEESAVLALERSFILYGQNEQWAFEAALERVCSSVASGRFREFAWEHYDEVLTLKKELYVQYTSAFFTGIMNGVVEVHKPKFRTRTRSSIQTI